jgi:hypothetical protein
MKLRVPSRPRTRKPIEAPGLYNVDRAFYHMDPCALPSLSSSIAKLLLKSPPIVAYTAHPRLGGGASDDSEAAELGTICHALLSGEKQRMRVLPYRDYKTEVAKRLRDEARRKGIVPVLEHKLDELRDAITALTYEMQAAGVPDPRSMLAEPTMVWREGGSVLCRARPDFLQRELVDPMTIVDIKTTARTITNDPDEIGRQVVQDYWDLQAAAYSAGVKAITGVSRVRFVFAVVSVSPPHPVVVFDLDPQLQLIGSKRWQQAVSRWAACMAMNAWPRGARRLLHAAAPAWAERAWLGEVFDRRLAANADGMQGPHDL